VLYGYPITATAENWLHDCLCAMLETVHSSLDSRQISPVWPDIIPENYRNRLSTRAGLQERLDKYAAAANRLSARNRQMVLTCMSQQNLIEGLVSCATDCKMLNDLPRKIQKPITELFGFAFELLTDLGVRDRHYHAIYAAASYHVCPFCGCEYFDAPGAVREDLDHYLLKSRYPFAAANLRNLVPMGMKCNERYKQAQDILRDNHGVRRKSFYPYADRQIDIVLDQSLPFGGADGRTPNWKIDFIVDCPECVTWDSVLSIRERFKRDVLDPSFFQWLRSFAAWFNQKIGLAEPADHQILEAMRQYVEHLRVMGLTGREFLRAPVFQMLYKQCREGNQRLLTFMKDLVMNAVPA
jgi:hypothetical protein